MNKVIVPVKTASEGTLAAAAYFALVRCLIGDPRIQAFYDEWLIAIGVAPLLAELQKDVDDDGIRADFREALKSSGRGDRTPRSRELLALVGDEIPMQAALERHRSIESRVSALISDEMKLPYPGLDVAVMSTFLSQAVATAGRMSRRLMMPVSFPTVPVNVTIEVGGKQKQIAINRLTIRAGRTPSRDALSTIDRNVRWFYRARVKQPPEAVAALAREEIGEGVGREGDGRSKIQLGIQRAESLLALTLPK